MPTLATGAVEDLKPISTMSSPAAHDVAPDHAQIVLPMRDQETTAEEEHGPTAPTGDQLHSDLEINFNGIPWEEDIWVDKEDLAAMKNFIVTISKALYVSDTLVVPPNVSC